MYVCICRAVSEKRIVRAVAEGATTLRDRKLGALRAARPHVILSANIGCIAHLGTAADVPVRHWIEWVDERLSGAAG